MVTIVWFIVEGPRDSTMGIPPFDNRLRSDEWTAQLHKHKILGYAGVYVDDLLIAGPRSLNDTLIRAVQGIWKTSAPEHLGPDPDCVPILRFLVIHLVLHFLRFQSILLWRRAQVPTSIHLSHRQRRLHRASMFGVRHIHTLLSLQIRSMWQPQQQLRSLNPADHVQRVLQRSTCLHLQKLRPCRQTFSQKTGNLE